MFNALNILDILLIQAGGSLARRTPRVGFPPPAWRRRTTPTTSPSLGKKVGNISQVGHGIIVIISTLGEDLDCFSL